MKRLVGLAQLGLRRLSELSMVALALLTLADVLGRYVFNVSVVGAVELTEALMVGVIFTGIVLATGQREHVTVDLLPLPFGPRGQKMMAAASQLLAIGISLLLGAVTWSQARSSLDFGDRTTMLAMPLAPVIFLMSAMLFVNAAVLALQLWTDWREQGAHD